MCSWCAIDSETELFVAGVNINQGFMFDRRNEMNSFKLYINDEKLEEAGECMVGCLSKMGKLMENV